MDTRIRVLEPVDEQLAARLRFAYSNVSGVLEKKMFGGIAFMVNGHMYSPHIA